LLAHVTVFATGLNNPRGLAFGPMSANAPRRTRPNGAPAGYLGRPASFWITIATRGPRMTRPLES
jgi:hypothetical protein